MLLLATARSPSPSYRAIRPTLAVLLLTGRKTLSFANGGADLCKLSMPPSSSDCHHASRLMPRLPSPASSPQIARDFGLEPDNRPKSGKKRSATGVASGMSSPAPEPRAPLNREAAYEVARARAAALALPLVLHNGVKARLMSSAGGYCHCRCVHCCCQAVAVPSSLLRPSSLLLASSQRHAMPCR